MAAPKDDKGSPDTNNSSNVEFTYLNAPPVELDFMTIPRSEGTKEKFIRKTKENPFVPIGLSVTLFALTYGVLQLKTGNSLRSQSMMRLRVGAQAFTIVALIGGLFYEAKKQPKAHPPS